VEVEQDSGEDGVQGYAQERAEERWSEWVFGVEGQVT
jgi:hypothetical protein